MSICITFLIFATLQTAVYLTQGLIVQKGRIEIVIRLFCNHNIAVKMKLKQVSRTGQIVYCTC